MNEIRDSIKILGGGKGMSKVAVVCNMEFFIPSYMCVTGMYWFPWRADGGKFSFSSRANSSHSVVHTRATRIRNYCYFIISAPSMLGQISAVFVPLLSSQMPSSY